MSPLTPGRSRPRSIVRTLEYMEAELRTMKNESGGKTPPVELLYDLGLLRYHMAELQSLIVEQCKAENVPWDAIGEALGSDEPESTLRFL